MTSLLVIRSLSSDTFMNVDPWNVVEIAATGAEVKTSKTAAWHRRRQAPERTHDHNVRLNEPD